MKRPDKNLPARSAKTPRPPWEANLDAALVPLAASLAPWGVCEVHWLPGRDSTPVIWLRTRTKAERARLETQGWLMFQVNLALSSLGVAHHLVRSIRAEITSVEDEEFLFRD